MIEDKPVAKKWVRIYEEDDATISSWETTDYVTDVEGDDSWNKIMIINTYASMSGQVLQNISARG